MERIKNILRTYLNKDIGLILNLSNCTFKNDGENVHIIIPIKELDKFGGKIESHSETSHFWNKDQSEKLYTGKAIITPEKDTTKSKVNPIIEEK